MGRPLTFPSSHWNPERDAAFKPKWENGESVDAILAAINAIPGPRPITDRRTLAKRAEVLCVKRQDWYMAEIRRQISACANAARVEQRKGTPREAEDVRLRELWLAGEKTAEIGRKMGLGKNTVISRAHRMGLKSRPSPIQASGSGKPRIPRLGGSRHSLPSGRGLAALGPLLPIPASAYVWKPRACAMPLWGSGRPTHLFCSQPTIGRHAYCIDHMRTCFSNAEALIAAAGVA